MNEFFKIFVEQLRDGHSEKISENVSPEFLHVNETDLVFQKDVAIKGEAYLADESLVLHLNVATEAILPCSICNEKTAVKVKIDNFYHAEPLSEIKSGIYNFSDALRTEILVEVPPYVECHNGNCPKRIEFEKYMKKSEDGDSQDGYRPFAEL